MSPVPTSADTDDGVPLAHYRQHEGCGVEITCNVCVKRRVVGLEAVIARLVATGRGGPQTGVRAIARLIREPCGCGARSWDTRPAFRAGIYADGVIPPALLIEDQERSDDA
ncbi:hypothetical protein [Phenylobacterium sp.]|uniref:hypothetical protein n=1 Tax=Phenylobacterium sp. TaxID=1871053 RepID=UPI00273171C5|nr:hypothetical protein [Phenylobacterium sp.]MDP1872548.1 hypothetical protein [Phenylobacterium sp.]